MIRLTLTSDERAAVQALRHDATLSPAERDRVEIVLLSAEGWSPPRIGTYLGYHAATVRRLLIAIREDGLSSLRRRPPGPPPDTARREQVTTVLDRLLDQDRTWTSAQLAAALAEQGIVLSPRQARRYLRGMGVRWRRTVHTLKHKQDATKAERAQRVLGSLKQRPAPDGSASSTSMSAASRPASR